MTLGMPSIPLTVLVLVGVASPALLLAVLGVASLLNRPLPERWTGLLAGSSMAIACAVLVIALGVHGLTGTGVQRLSYGAWSTTRDGGIAIEFLVDRLSLAFAALSTAIAGIVAAFSNRYLHREAGYNRYFVLLAIFVTGMLLIALAGNVAVLFVGWELVGLSSALLVAFFQERPAAVSNAFRVVSVYRISDAAMLSAVVWLRHVAGTDSLSVLFGGAAPTAGLTTTNATIIAMLLIVAVAGKSALLPFSSWLPRAMEGPTPSSAVYYGSLSIHAGCFLLLRAGPLLEQVPAARVCAFGLGAATALFAGSPGGPRVFSLAAIPECAERSPRPARTRRRDRRTRLARSPSQPGAIRSCTSPSVPMCVGTRVPGQHSRSGCGRAVYAARDAAHTYRQAAVRRGAAGSNARPCRRG
jgi:NAD(P)H-quinone oxidoreductase subunit 5